MSASPTQSQPAYLQRYQADDDGVRFMPGAEFRYGHLPPVPDGILGDRILRGSLKTDLLKRQLTLEDVRRPAFSIDELNDLTAYWSWDLWDQLSLRASEGSSGLVPRQEYEALSFANAFYRWPEFMIDMTDRLGIDGIVNLARSGREPANKINMLHSWCLGAVTQLGRALYLIMGHNTPDEYLPELTAAMKFWQALVWGYRGDGYLWSSQNRYTTAALDDGWTQRLRDSMEPLTDETGPDFTALMASAELQSFYLHLDNRLGMYDLGPFVLDNGNPMIVRSTFTREDAYSWSLFARDLPHAMTFVFEIDAAEMQLEEARVLSIGTLMTRPRNYVSSIVKGSVWVRDEWDSELRQVPLAEATAKYLTGIGNATGDIFEWMTRTPRRHLIENGAFTYYVGMILPFMRKAGLYDHYCENHNLWEFDERASRVYYELGRNNFARIVVPTRLFTSSETSFAPISADAPLWRSKYAYV
ncbi:MAG: hypothetical protein GEU74_15230 [Nitriliruptorales bacterium]|nr:hypothetical protein [Nitriliruptorales bacterium]